MIGLPRAPVSFFKACAVVSATSPICTTANVTSFATHFMHLKFTGPILVTTSGGALWSFTLKLAPAQSPFLQVSNSALTSVTAFWPRAKIVDIAPFSGATATPFASSSASSSFVASFSFFSGSFFFTNSMPFVFASGTTSKSSVSDGMPGTNCAGRGWRQRRGRGRRAGGGE